MPDLIAQGPNPHDRWRRSLPEAGIEIVLGRSAEPWSTPWDDRISRQHATAQWNGRFLEVVKLASARNSIFFRGQQRENFLASLGDHFVIGQTTFTLLDQQLRVEKAESPAFTEQTFSAHLLRNNKYRDADRRIEALSKLPDIIGGASNDKELCVRVVNLLLQGVSKAEFVAIVRIPTASAADSVGTGPNSQALEILHWDCRNISGQQHVAPSARLVRSAVQSQESVLHLWNRARNTSPDFSQSENIDWAFCTPVLSAACPGWGIYVAGNFAANLFVSPADRDQSDDLQDDLKFTELAATTIGALRQVHRLQRQQDGLRNFFAPVVLNALSMRDPEQVLTPRETEVSVLFCDLRGFSQKSEDAADRLLELLQRVSDALGVMTHQILAAGGVVGDFHGDAAMGFWGWPIADTHSITQACQAAIAIRNEFELFSAQPNHPLAGFRAGIGIASGSAVAGRIGTTDQVKVTVFGPVVNLASRLEGLTKQLQAAVLVDEPTAGWVRDNVSTDKLRVRRVAKVLPYGMHTPLIVSELLPPAGSASILTNAHIAAYEEALDHFLAGRWNDAFRLLHQVPAEDQVKDSLTVYIAQHRRTPPPDWQGVIAMPAK
ncbi:MAG: adenylate/guanylate cyclase domain-containing protein [Planctomycetales bacterium]|nr:adenylate/guanylate cyclase domain-containing protein [Planctomycetales bacterium]